MKVDSHSHSKYSHDGRADPLKMLEAAKAKGLGYYAVTEHLDRDYKYCRKERFLKQLNLPGYYKRVEKLRSVDFGGIYFAFGVEAAYCEKATPWYEKELKKYDFDVVINSIHTIHGGDAYFGRFYRGREQDEVYNEYLGLLAESLKVPYAYDIVGHIGYITRYCDYPNVSLVQPQYLDKIDALLKEIIARDKCIEINTHIRHPLTEFLPERAILERYYALGGRKITFSSDAHVPSDVGAKYPLAAQVAKDIGFTEWTVYKRHIPVTVPIDDPES